MPYTEKDLIVPARRYNNTKRKYLLVNTKQGKHVPVTPNEAVQMMAELGDKVKGLLSDGNLPALVIGFAETATAVGGVVASRLGACYRHTTREDDPCIKNWLYFEETHSHATEQKLALDDLEEVFRAVKSIVIVDDELTTGNTIINLLAALKDKVPDLDKKRLIAATLVSRVRGENLLRLAQSGVEVVSLCEPDTTDEQYEAAIDKFDATGAPRVDALPEDDVPISLISNLFKKNETSDMIVMSAFCKGKTLVLGTEEWMFHPLLCANQLRKSEGIDVRFYATTRSPIAICDDSSYPVRNGYEIHSLYDGLRKNYIYNLDQYDSAIVMSNCPFLIDKNTAGVKDIARALHAYGTKNVAFINQVQFGMMTRGADE